MWRKPPTKGFTLIELIVTLVALSALMAGTAVYITNTTLAYNNISQRNQLATLGRLTVERVTREIRNALPNSIRIAGNCIEYLPILGSSVYLDLPTDTAASNFNAAGFTPAVANGSPYVVVYPYDRAALYTGANPGPRAAFTSAAGSPVSSVTLAAAHQFNRHAPQRRFYIVDSPTSLCVSGTDLLRYRGYSITAAQNAPPAGNPELFAEHVQLNDSGAIIPFRYSPGTLQRNAVVALDLRFQIDGEWIRLFHEVQIRNVL